MKHIVLGLVVMGFNLLAYAGKNDHTFVMDKISFQVAAKKWVETTTAKVTVNINATLNQTSLVKARNEIMTQLNKIAKSDWHITSFNRSQDSSGLEKLTVRAQARVKQQLLTDVYHNAKSISRPGMSYEIGSIEFKPGVAEIQSVKNQLRSELYEKVKAEIKNLNQVYTNQSYSINRLVFIDGNNPPQFKQAKSGEMINAMVLRAPAPQLSVSDELVMSAHVEAASNRVEGK